MRDDTIDTVAIFAFSHFRLPCLIRQHARRYAAMLRLFTFFRHYARLILRNILE